MFGSRTSMSGLKTPAFGLLKKALMQSISVLCEKHHILDSHYQKI